MAFAFVNDDLMDIGTWIRLRQLSQARLPLAGDLVGVHRNFYWLEAEAPQAGLRLVAECEGQTIRIRDAKDAGALVVHLSDAYIDLDRPIRVERDGAVVYEGKAQRSLTHIQQSIERFGDPQRVYSSSIRVAVPTSR